MINTANTQLPLFYRCCRCKEIKPLNAFPRNRQRRSGVHNACKECHARIEAARYHEKKDLIRAARRLRRHGVSAETFDFLLRTQRGRCGDCETNFSELRASPCVDHDAESGRVRALLCSGCNLRIGMARHSIDVLFRDIIYLLKHTPTPVAKEYVQTLVSLVTLFSLHANPTLSPVSA
jgi:Recombination endonuclease VII